MVLEWLADPLAVPHASLLQGKLSNRLGGGGVLLTAFESVITSHFIRQRPTTVSCSPFAHLWALQWGVVMAVLAGVGYYFKCGQKSATVRICEPVLRGGGVCLWTASVCA